MSVLQWLFLILAIGSAIAELHFGTIYLAGLALAALATVAVGFVAGPVPEVVVFGIASVAVIVAVPVMKRRLGGHEAPSLDVGQMVVFVREGRCAGEAVVNYRGALWEADIDPRERVVAGTAGRITSRDGNRLKVVVAGLPNPVAVPKQS